MSDTSENSENDPELRAAIQLSMGITPTDAPPSLFQNPYAGSPTAPIMNDNLQDPPIMSDRPAQFTTNTAAFANAPIKQKASDKPKLKPQIQQRQADLQIKAVRAEQARKYALQRSQEEEANKRLQERKRGRSEDGDEAAQTKDEKEQDDDAGFEIMSARPDKKVKREKEPFASVGYFLGNTDAIPSNAASSSSTSPQRNLRLGSGQSILYPTPRIFLTRTAGRLEPPHSRNTITLGSILDKTTMQSCFIFSFFIGQEELFEYLPVTSKLTFPPKPFPRKVPVYIGRDLNLDPYLQTSITRLQVERPEGKKTFTREQHNGIIKDLAKTYAEEYGENYKAIYTDMVGRTGCVHTKIGIIKYEGFLRVFITSGNLMALDTVHGDNHWFVVDLPELPQRRPKSAFPPDFEQELLEHATLLGCPLEFINSIYGRYNYDSVSRCHLVASIPGNHSAEKATLYGALRLREVVRPYMRTKVEPLMEICAGSIGGMQDWWLRGMYHCFSGSLYDDKGKSNLPPFKIFFPTKADVDATRSVSRQGSSQIGSHFKYFESAKGIQEMFHHYESKDQAMDTDTYEDEAGRGALFHQKLYMCFRDNGNDTDPPLWLCIGSHNLSKAAWGNPKDDLRKKRERVKRLADVANFELSVVIPGDSIEAVLEPGSNWQDIVPHRRNTARYSGKDKPFNSSAWVKNGGDGMDET